MKFTRGTYPDIPGTAGSPCWKLTGRWLYADADWNTRFPYGVCLAVRGGRNPRPGFALDAPLGFTLDLNAPLGEPNRLYLWLGPVKAILGLPQFRDEEVIARETTAGGKRVVHVRHFNRRVPRIAGCDRYRYHKTEDGDWARDPKPAPLHWGWLTIEHGN